ncbi:unnamed protein product [Peronospora farinosa]|uniref:BZIP domain-containing protein n=1 Tax=Peronospora farinosa TaxID=134698 RepID=A0AAV0TAB0_9STRA|nr:unnamed protein product [Peronospora farinosa]CAI5715226.1 unnamed protein product [Peronospora farinosa]
MAYRKPYDLYDSILSDQAMMEEVLELLGSDSTSTGHEKKLTATFNNNRDAVCNEVANENELLGWDEEKYPRKQEQDLPRDQTQSTMESLMPSTPMHLTEAASKSPSLLPQQFFHGAVPQPFSAEPCFVNFTAAPESRQSLRAPVQENMIVRETVTADPIPISPPASILHHTLQDSQPLSKSATLVTHLNSESNVLPTGQRIRVINPDEFEELRRKVQMQTASRRYRKRKKAS